MHGNFLQVSHWILKSELSIAKATDTYTLLGFARQPTRVSKWKQLLYGSDVGWVTKSHNVICIIIHANSFDCSSIEQVLKGAAFVLNFELVPKVLCLIRSTTMGSLRGRRYIPTPLDWIGTCILS